MADEQMPPDEEPQGELTPEQRAANAAWERSAGRKRRKGKEVPPMPYPPPGGQQGAPGLPSVDFTITPGRQYGNPEDGGGMQFFERRNEPTPPPPSPPPQAPPEVVPEPKPPSSDAEASSAPFQGIGQTPFGPDPFAPAPKPAPAPVPEPTPAPEPAARGSAEDVGKWAGGDIWNPDAPGIAEQPWKQQPPGGGQDMPGGPGPGPGPGREHIGRVPEEAPFQSPGEARNPDIDTVPDNPPFGAKAPIFPFGPAAPEQPWKQQPPGGGQDMPGGQAGGGGSEIQGLAPVIAEGITILENIRSLLEEIKGMGGGMG